MHKFTASEKQENPSKLLNYSYIRPVNIVWISLWEVKFMDWLRGFMKGPDILNVNKSRVVEFDDYILWNPDWTPLYQVKTESWEWFLMSSDLKVKDLWKWVPELNSWKHHVKLNNWFFQDENWEDIFLHTRKWVLRVSKIYRSSDTECFVKFENGFHDFFSLSQIDSSLSRQEAILQSKNAMIDNLKS